MLALAPAAFIPTQKAATRLPARPRVQVAASASSSDSWECPLLEECAGRQAKSSCVHPGRPVSQACGDCPRRKGGKVMVAKSKCIHPQRPLSAACADCPRLKKK